MQNNWAAGTDGGGNGGGSGGGSGGDGGGNRGNSGGGGGRAEEQKKEVTMTMLQFSTDNRSLKLFYFSQLICNCVGALGKKLQCNENSQD